MQNSNHIPIWRCLVAGLLAGMVNGFFGAGGGMLLVPLLVGFVGLQDQESFCSSIAVILPLCLVSLAVYTMQDRLPFQESLPYLPGAVLGGILAGLLFRKIPVRVLHILLGVLILTGGVRLLVC